MIPTLILIALALVWLGYETDWLTVRLPTGKAPQLKSGGLKPSLKDIISASPDSATDTMPYKPTEFIPLDMPKTTGNLNIICKRC